MSNSNPQDIKWDPASLEIEELNCSINEADFERLVDYVVNELQAKVVSKDELHAIASRERLRFFIHQALLRYEPSRHGNLAWYCFQRLKFLVRKWKRNQEEHKNGSAA